MRETGGWIGPATGDKGGIKSIRHHGIRVVDCDRSGKRRDGIDWENIPSDDFATRGMVQDQRFEDALDGNPDLWLYRRRSVGLLRRYVRLSLETGRLPSLLGRELFGGKVTSYKATTFEDRVIFVRDVEKSMGRMAEFDRQLLGRVFLQEHSHDQAAYLLHCSRSTLERRLLQALDLLSADFLRVGILAGMTSRRAFSG